MSSNLPRSSAKRGRWAECQISSAMNFTSHLKENQNYAEDKHTEGGRIMIGDLLGINRHNLRLEPCAIRSFATRDIDTSSSQRDDRRKIHRLSFGKSQKIKRHILTARKC